MSDLLDHLERGLMDEFEAVVPDSVPSSEDNETWDYPLRAGMVTADYSRVEWQDELRITHITFNEADDGFTASWPIGLMGVSGELECDDLGRLAAFLLSRGRAGREWIKQCLDADQDAGRLSDHDATMVRLSI